MEIKVGNYYKTRDGRKTYVGYERALNKYFYGHIVDTDVQIKWSEGGRVTLAISTSPLDLVAPWEDVEEIDVSAMWVYVIREYGLITAEHINHPKTPKDCLEDNVIAGVTVKDWMDIQQGKRKLIVGEGL